MKLKKNSHKINFCFYDNIVFSVNMQQGSFRQEPSRPIFVSAYFSIYSKSPKNRGDEIKQFQWRLKKFRMLLETGIFIVLFTDDKEPFTSLLQEFSENFRIGQVLTIQETDFFCAFHNKIRRLPNGANPEKDTAEFLWIMMLKTEFLERAIKMDVFNFKSSVYAWVDFSLAYIFKSPEGTLSFLKTLGNTEITLDTVYIPGCWGAKQNAEFENIILWRFCGGIIFGNTQHLLNMNQIIHRRMPEFLQEFDGTLTWEVNYWAWLEYHGYFQPSWYYADHDDWMVLGLPSRVCVSRITPEFQQGVICATLTDTTPTRLVVPECQPFGHPKKWSASSACFLRTSTDKNASCWLLTRYVNYRLDDYGNYLFPDEKDEGIIKNENVVCQLTLGENGHYVFVPETYRLVQTSNTISKIPCISRPMSVGFEDVRLFKNSQGSICYVATNVDKTARGLPQVATGELQLFPETEMAKFMSMKIHQTEGIQKNWIPWNDEEVIYKWCLDGVVFKHLVSGETRLVPFKVHNALLSRVRGSSIFISGWETGERIGVVHYSEEGHPRKYYHLLVVLRGETGELLRHTLPFYLGDQEKHQISFCVGFDWTKNNVGERLYHFWFSVMDREPRYWTVKEDGGGLRWCSYEGVISPFSLQRKWIE